MYNCCRAMLGAKHTRNYLFVDGGLDQDRTIVLEQGAIVLMHGIIDHAGTVAGWQRRLPPCASHGFGRANICFHAFVQNKRNGRHMGAVAESNDRERAVAARLEMSRRRFERERSVPSCRAAGFSPGNRQIYGILEAARGSSSSLNLQLARGSVG